MSAAQVNVEHMFEYWYASRPTPESAAPLGRVREAARAEAQAAARRLVAIGELLVLRCRETTRRKTGPSASPPNPTQPRRSHGSACRTLDLRRTSTTRRR